MSVLEKAYEIYKDSINKKQKSVEKINDIEAHIGDVVEACAYLLDNEPKLVGLGKEVRDYAIASALLHDVGKFYDSKEDHGDLGYKVLVDLYNFNIPVINLAVKHHNKKDRSNNSSLMDDEGYLKLSDEDKELCLLLLKITKDADKTANLRMLPIRGGAEYSKGLRELYISDTVKKTVVRKELVDYSDTGTCFDDFLCWTAWQFEISFETTLNIIEEEKLTDGFFKKIFEYVDVVYNDLVAQGSELEKLDRQKAKLIEDLKEVRKYFV